MTGTMQDVSVCWHMFFPCQHNLPLYGSLDQAPFDFCLPQNGRGTHSALQITEAGLKAVQMSMKRQP